MIKKCSKCLEDKEEINFTSQTYKRKDGNITKYYTTVCKKCSNKARYTNKTNTPEKLALYKQKANERRRKSYYNNKQRDHDKVKKFIDNLIKNGKFKTIWLKRRYGITIDDYNNMLSTQNYSCGICKIPLNTYGRAFGVDHCHTTGKVRGLLCHSCNLSLGGFFDNIIYLKNAINYLEK